MEIRIAGQPIPSTGALKLSTADGLEVEGAELKKVWIAGKEGSPFNRTGTSFYPPALIQNRLDTSGIIQLCLETSSTLLEVTIERMPVKLSESELLQMLNELRELSVSYIDDDIHSLADAKKIKNDKSKNKLIKTEDERIQELYQILEQHLPPLLETPLQILSYESGSVPVRRAVSSTRGVLQQILSPERTHILGIAMVEKESKIDYRWLGGVIYFVITFASRYSRIRNEIRDDVKENTFWKDVISKSNYWMNKKLIKTNLNRQIREPTWTLSRSVHGAAIIEAVRKAKIENQISVSIDWEGGIDDIIRYPVDDHAHLYEIWVIMSIVELLISNFRFKLISNKKWVRDYVEYKSGVGWCFTESIYLIWQGFGLDGTSIHLKAELQHEPKLKAKDRDYLTPDLVLILTGGEKDCEYKTIHVLDMKYSRLSAIKHARNTGKIKYGKGLLDTPVSSFVVLPHPDASIRNMMDVLDRHHRTTIDLPERKTLITRPNGRYAFAWGSVEARPGNSIGLRQFLMLALQYHRTELRPLCGQCGYWLTLTDLRVVPSGHSRLCNASNDDRKLAANRDERIGEILSTDELIYSCPECKHTWKRHACKNGHILLKYGELTPHLRRDDQERNVVCSACGHYKAGRQW